MAGRATYNQYLHLWDKASGNLTDFQTHFSFSIDSQTRRQYGDGLTFFLAPQGSRLDSDIARGGGLGIGIDDRLANTTNSSFVAVEFDTFSNMNYLDLATEHVGIDINSMISVASVRWECNITAGTRNDAWITYSSETHVLNVTFTGFENNKTVLQNLHHVLDLRLYLPEWVTFGFSAATGGRFARHTIHSWDFKSTLNLTIHESEAPIPSTAPNPDNGDKVGLAVGLGVGGFILVGGLVMVWIIFWKKKRTKKNIDDDIVFDEYMDDEFERGKGPRKFSFSELAMATDNFREDEKLGQGGFGEVYRGFLKDSDSHIAIKRLKPDSKQGAREFKTEIEMLSQLRHIHLVSLIGYCDDGNEMIIVYDYMSRGTLRSHLYDHGQEPSLRWKQRLQICIGAARGLQYLHSGTKCVIIHRDVKTTNILLDEKWVAKVSDFGLSKVGSIDMSKTHVTTEVKGSFGYLDPEYYRYQRLTEKSDIYAFGVVLCEALCGRPAVISSEDMRQENLANWVRWCNSENMMAQIIDKSIEPEIAPECLRKFIEIAVSCIEDEGSQRPSMDDVVWGLKIALQLQNTFEGVAEECMSTRDVVFDENVSNLETNGQGSNFAHNKGLSNFFHTEIMELRDGRL